MVLKEDSLERSLDDGNKFFFLSCLRNGTLIGQLCVYRLIYKMHDHYVLRNNGRSHRHDRKRIDDCRALQDVH